MDDCARNSGCFQCPQCLLDYFPLLLHVVRLPQHVTKWIFDGQCTWYTYLLCPEGHICHQYRAQPHCFHRSRQHGSRPHRSRGASRRNLLYMGIITLLCIFIASFLAIMQWYAAEVDMAEIKKGVTKSMKEQVKEELLKEMQNQKK